MYIKALKKIRCHSPEEKYLVLCSLLDAGFDFTDVMLGKIARGVKAMDMSWPLVHMVGDNTIDCCYETGGDDVLDYLPDMITGHSDLQATANEIMNLF